MAAKTILYQENARKALEKGMDIIAEAVSITTRKGFRSDFCRFKDKTRGSKNGLSVLQLSRSYNAGANGPRAWAGFFKPITVI